MIPLHPAPLLGAIALASGMWSAIRIAGALRDLTLLERLCVALLTLWMIGLALALAIGSWPGGFRPLPQGIGALLMALAIWRCVPPGSAPHWPRDLWRALLGRPRPERLLCFGFAMTLTMLSIQMLRLPPTGVDSLGYHLLGPADWVASGQIQRIATFWDWANSYPQNVETLAALSMVFLPDLRFADLPNLLWLLLIFAGLAATARSLGAHPFAIALAALSLLLSPFVIAYASATYVDLPVAGCYVAALALLLAARRTGTWAPVAWTGVALLLAAGSKASALPIAMLFGLCGWQLLRDVSLPRLRAGQWLPGALGLTLALAGWWYLRAWWWYGNPLHPWTIAIGGWELFHGPAGPYAAHIESLDTLFVGSRQPYLLGLARYFGHFGGELRLQLHWAREWFGPQVSIAGTIAIGWWLARSCITRDRIALWLLGLGLVIALLNPVPMVPRFAAHWPIWTTIALSLLLTSAGALLRIATTTILTLSLALTLLLLPWSLIPIDESVLMPDRYFPYGGATFWWTEQLLRPGDTVLYVQPLRATGRALPNDLSARLRYLAPASFNAEAAMSRTGTTWLLLADEDRVTATAGGIDREQMFARVQQQAPELEYRLMASGSTFTLRNYRIYALRWKEPAR